jgi:hypothetical protein
MKPESRTVDRSDQVDSLSQRHLPLVDLLVDTRAKLMELAVASGLQVLTTMLEEDRTAICGLRYQHQAERPASRTGTAPSEVVLGGRQVALRRPRVRANGAEVPLPTFQLMASEDPLNRRVVEQMLVGVATRQYARSLEVLPKTMESRGASKSAVSRRFVAKTASQLAAWRATTLDAIDLVALLIDGVHIGEHCIVVALGIDHTGRKHALGLWDVRPRMRPSVRASPICRAVGCGPTATSWSSSMARRPCTKAGSSDRRPRRCSTSFESGFWRD